MKLNIIFILYMVKLDFQLAYQNHFIRNVTSFALMLLADKNWKSWQIECGS